VAGYRVGGKTGTVKKFAPGGYSDSRYTALFSGVAPVTNPRLAVVVVVDEPSGEMYYGGQVAAPVFSAVVSGALRILAIPPDHFPRPDSTDTTGTTLAANLQ
jgi:cell division protein FtsI (penicillin-binding protein 3)